MLTRLKISKAERFNATKAQRHEDKSINNYFLCVFYAIVSVLAFSWQTKKITKQYSVMKIEIHHLISPRRGEILKNQRSLSVWK